jgi:hypothetical protein
MSAIVGAWWQSRSRRRASPAPAMPDTGRRRAVRPRRSTSLDSHRRRDFTPSPTSRNTRRSQASVSRAAFPDGSAEPELRHWHRTSGSDQRIDQQKLRQRTRDFVGNPCIPQRLQRVGHFRHKAEVGWPRDDRSRERGRLDVMHRVAGEVLPYDCHRRPPQVSRSCYAD